MKWTRRRLLRYTLSRMFENLSLVVESLLRLGLSCDGRFIASSSGPDGCASGPFSPTVLGKRATDSLSRNYL